jgi:transcription antitermination factor NusG
VGQQVQVEAGPFAGLSGVIHALNGHERVTLLLSVLGGERTVSIPSTSLARSPVAVRLAR